MSLGRQGCEIFTGIPRTLFDFLLQLLSGANMFVLEESPLITGSKNKVERGGCRRKGTRAL